MTARKKSFSEKEWNLQGLIATLTSAACEWLLIFLLLVDAVLSYVLTKFAHYCKLQRPCVLCSRLDHIFSNEKPDNYQNLLCRNHRLEISYLISCHTHDKLVDGNKMCDDCLCSFTTKNKCRSISETHRLLGGKLRLGFSGNGFQCSLLNKDPISALNGTCLCSCCGRPWSLTQNAQRFLRPSSGFAVNKPNIPLPRFPGRRCLSRRDSLKKIGNKFSGSVTSHHVGKTGTDPLSHVGYTELKINSDSESEVPFSDDDYNGSLIRERNEPNEYSAVQCTSHKSWLKNHDIAKLSSQSYDTVLSLLDSCVHVDIQKPQNEKIFPSDAANGYGLGEKQVHQKAELISLDEMPPISKIMELPYGESTEKNKLRFPPAQDCNSFDLSELITLDDAPSSVGTSPVKSEETGPSDTGHVSINKHEDVLDIFGTPAGGCPKTDWSVYDPAIMKPIDKSNLHESSNRNKVEETVSFGAEQPTLVETEIVSEDLTQMSLPNTSSGGTNLSSNKSSSNVASGSCEVQELKKSVSIGFDLETLDGSYVSEIEGESLVDRLKRQIEYDKKCISSLYKELEEERNASEVAVNQAMAMITKLQEEKAALHMEALQYLRMMEEQAEYDVEALEKANDLLSEKEKEIQDLEAELEIYRLSSLDVGTVVENTQEEIHYMKGENSTVEIIGRYCKKEDAFSSPVLMTVDPSKGNNEPLAVETSSLEFKDERMDIQERLKCLEMKLHQISCTGISSSIPNGIDSGKLVDDGKDQDATLNINSILLNKVDQNGPSYSRPHSAEEGPIIAPDDDTDHFVSRDEKNSSLIRKRNHIDQRKPDFVAIQNEILELNDRLEVLEADHDFLERSLNSLCNGNDGLHFIKEIAIQLQELRKIGLRCQSVP